jgi:hypothetical protein
VPQSRRLVNASATMAANLNASLAGSPHAANLAFVGLRRCGDAAALKQRMRVWGLGVRVISSTASTCTHPSPMRRHQPIRLFMRRFDQLSSTGSCRLVLAALPGSSTPLRKERQWAMTAVCMSRGLRPKHSSSSKHAGAAVACSANMCSGFADHWRAASLHRHSRPNR